MIREDVLKATNVAKGRTKDEIAEKLGVGHSYVSRTVNSLLEDGKLRVVGQSKPHTGRPAPKYSSTF